MSAQYIMKKMPDIHGTGEEITYSQMVMTGQTGTRELAEYISAKCAFAKGVTEGVILELGEALAHEMAMGRSVKIEGIGVSHPHLPCVRTKNAKRPMKMRYTATPKASLWATSTSGPIKDWSEKPAGNAVWSVLIGVRAVLRKNTFRNNVWT